MNNLLAKASQADVRLEPFPHLVLKDALPEELCDALLEGFPSCAAFAGGPRYGSNRRYDLSRKVMRERGVAAPVWEEFLAAQSDDAFLRDFLALFGTAVDRAYPGLLAGWGGAGKARRGNRTEDRHDRYDILTEAYASINTPSKRGDPTVRRVHVDDPKKLYAGLFYLRHPDDDSEGGDLELYAADAPEVRFWRQDADKDQLRLFRTVKYERNVLVLFLNSIGSFHGVSPRGPARLPRYFVNLVGEVAEPLFDLQRRQMPWLQGLRHRLAGRLSGRKAY